MPPHLSGPFVLVGHSLGGLFARLYAQDLPPTRCARLCSWDAFGVEIPSLTGSEWPAYRQQLDGPLPQFTDSPSFEVIDIDKSVEQVAAAAAFPTHPHRRVDEDRALLRFHQRSRPGRARSSNRRGRTRPLTLSRCARKTPHISATRQ